MAAVVLAPAYGENVVNTLWKCAQRDKVEEGKEDQEKMIRSLIQGVFTNDSHTVEANYSPSYRQRVMVSQVIGSEGRAVHIDIIDQDLFPAVFITASKNIESVVKYNNFLKTVKLVMRMTLRPNNWRITLERCIMDGPRLFIDRYETSDGPVVDNELRMPNRIEAVVAEEGTLAKLVGLSCSVFEFMKFKIVGAASSVACGVDYLYSARA